MKPIHRTVHEVADREAQGRRFALRYGRVYFDLRKRFDLTVEECLLLDVLETLSRRTGWCYASRAYLAEAFGISKRSLQRMLARLRAEGLVERKAGRTSPTRADWFAITEKMFDSVILGKSG